MSARTSVSLIGMSLIAAEEKTHNRSLDLSARSY